MVTAHPVAVVKMQASTQKSNNLFFVNDPGLLIFLALFLVLFWCVFMKHLLDFLPLVIFFILFKLYDIYVGVSGLMIASTLSFILTGLIYKKIDNIMLFGCLSILIFGAMTLYFHDANFIKWKVTIIYLVFATILLVSQFILKKPILQKMLSEEIKLDDNVWKKIHFIWFIFFLMCAITNLYVTYFMSESAWATFKVFVLPAATIVFTALSGLYIYKKHSRI